MHTFLAADSWPKQVVSLHELISQTTAVETNNEHQHICKQCVSVSAVSCLVVLLQTAVYYTYIFWLVANALCGAALQFENRKTNDLTPGPALLSSVYHQRTLYLLRHFKKDKKDLLKVTHSQYIFLLSLLPVSVRQRGLIMLGSWLILFFPTISRTINHCVDTQAHAV